MQVIDIFLQWLLRTFLVKFIFCVPPCNCEIASMIWWVEIFCSCKVLINSLSSIVIFLYHQRKWVLYKIWISSWLWASWNIVTFHLSTSFFLIHILFCILCECYPFLYGILGAPWSCSSISILLLNYISPLYNMWILT